MSKYIYGVTASMMLLASACLAETVEKVGVPPLPEPTQSPTPTEIKKSYASFFEIDSSELDSSASLNRIAGNVDRGYSSPEQSYKSTEQKSGNPLKSRSE